MQTGSAKARRSSRRRSRRAPRCGSSSELRRVPSTRAGRWSCAFSACSRRCSVSLRTTGAPRRRRTALRATSTFSNQRCTRATSRAPTSRSRISARSREARGVPGAQGAPQEGWQGASPLDGRDDDGDGRSWRGSARRGRFPALVERSRSDARRSQPEVVSEPLLRRPVARPGRITTRRDGPTSRRRWRLRPRRS